MVGDIVVTSVETARPVPAIDEMWRVIVEVHNEAKSLCLVGEELERKGFRSFIQPFNELRHAYEHLIRAKADELGFSGGNEDPEYQYTSLTRTLGHEYRAFFDWADWVAVIARESIQKMLAGYTVTCIATALSDYYTTMQPRIESISKSVAEIRGDKDISRQHNSQIDDVRKDATVVEEVRKYKGLLNELLDIRERISAAIPRLEECRTRLRKESRGKWIWAVIGSLLVAAITFTVTRLTTPHVVPSSSPNLPPIHQPIKTP